MIPEEDFQIKLKFPDFVRRFERENTNVIEFGSALPFAKKIDRIREVFKSYVQENTSKIEQKPTQNTLEPIS